MRRAQLLPYLLEASKRGVLFDVGHGGAAFEFRQAVPAVKQGFFPDSISTDVHAGSLNSGDERPTERHVEVSEYGYVVGRRHL